jgi:hypothetical protein
VLQVSERTEFAEKASFPRNSGGHFEEFVDEPILTPDIDEHWGYPRGYGIGNSGKDG